MESENDDFQKSMLEKEIVAVAQSSAILKYIINERDSKQELKTDEEIKYDGIAGEKLDSLYKEGVHKAYDEWISKIELSKSFEDR